MGLKLIGAPMKFGADEAGLDLSIESLVGYNSAYGKEIEIVRVDSCNDVFESSLKHLILISDYCSKLAAVTHKAFEKGMLPIVIGGDHSVSIGSVSGVSKGRRLGLFWIDAHGDFNIDKTTKTGHIHGMPLSTLVGLGAKRLKDCFYLGPKIRKDSVVLMGTRSLDQKEKVLIDVNRIKFFSYDYLVKDGIKKALDLSFSYLPADLDGIHISLDLDALDPKLCPGVSVPVKGGFVYADIEMILERLFATGKVSSMDIVEYNPAYDINDKTVIILDEIIKFVKRLYKKYGSMEEMQ